MRETVFVSAVGLKVASVNRRGVDARWRSDGKELFYVAPDRKLMSVEVKSGSSFEAGIPRVLFRSRAMMGTTYARYAVKADRRRFLVISEIERVESPPATVVLNWTAGMKK